MLLELIEKYALENNVPIMQKDGIEFLTKYIKENNIKNILEIGTAIGYSAIKMALVDNDIHVTTIEREIERYEIAIKNIESFNLQDKIKVIHADAFDVNLTDTYDLIFIDAAKSQYIKFFEKFTNNLIKGGVVVSDNLDFHGLINSNLDELSSNVRGIITKLNRYINFLKENNDYKTTFYSIGDGISVSIKL